MSSTSVSPTSFETIFTTALKEYKKQTKRDIASHPLVTQLQSCDSSSAVIAMLRTQVQTFDQGADERWTKWLDPTINVLFAFSATIGSGVGVVFPPANAIFAGIGVLLQAVQDVRDSQDALIELFGRMEFFFNRLEKYIDVRPSAAMTDVIVKIMVEVISILGIVTKEVGQGRTKRYLKKLVGRKDIENALQRLDKLTQEEVRMAAAEALVITRNIDDTVKDVDKRLERVDERVQDVDGRVKGVKHVVQGVGHAVRGVDHRVKGVDHKVVLISKGVTEAGLAIQQVSNHVNYLSWSELRKDMRKWMTPPDPSVNYIAATDAHHEGTAAWCTKGDTVADWKASGSLLWIHGKPGSGKSILSSVIIRDIKTMFNAGSAFLAYFYFDFKDTAKQDSRALLSSLLSQLSDQSDICCDALLSFYMAHNQGLEQPTTDSLSECFKHMLMIVEQVPPIYLIIDALDECPSDSGVPSSREKVLELVSELVELRHTNLRLCVTSRPEFDIRTTLEPLATQKLCLHDESGQQQDIVDYVTSVVRSDKKMKKWRDDEKNMVIDKLTEKADGMFRWVFCQLEVLRHSFPTNLRRTLEELPKSLDDTYKRILKEINNANRVHAYRLLQCLMVASRPLSVEELAEMLAFDLSTGGVPKLNADWRWEDQEEAVLSACSSLVSIIVENGSRVVQFSHFSVKEFLTSHRLASCMEEVSWFHIPIEPSHATLARACLSVLLCLDDHTDQDSVNKIPLYRYAAEHWVGHVQVGNVESQIKDVIDYFFDMDKPHFSAWVRIQSLTDLLRLSADEEPRATPPPAAPLYFAAWRGFRSPVERLILKHSEQINHLGGLFGTPLHASVLGGHIEVAQLLFAHGADVESRCAEHWTPLHTASNAGHLEIAKWLLKCGVDVNSHTNICSTALGLAAANGHLEVARILLERDAEVNSPDEHGYTPLLLASEFGHADIVRLLLDNNADVHPRGCDGIYPLYWPAIAGNVEVARMLLEHAADVNSQDSHGCTPLLIASEMGYLDLVRLLLKHDADACIRGVSGLSPLHKATLGGHLEVARVLLERNAEVNNRDDHGCTPLLNASWDGRHDVVQLLLEYNADVNLCGDAGFTPLHKAAGGHLEIARMLLEHNAEVDPRDHQQCTPLHHASAFGTPEIVSLLLDNNADAYMRDGDGDTPLHCAAYTGLLDNARLLLLERNLDVNSRNEKGNTPLHQASEGVNEGNPDVVRLLLDHGADAQARNLDGKTASEVARGPRQQEIVQLLAQHIVG